MSLFEILGILIVLATCLYVSYTDARFKRIGNPYTYGLAACGLVCQGVFAYLGITTTLEALWLVVGGLAVAFLLYYLGISSPGTRTGRSWITGGAAASWMSRFPTIL